jgi:hypothetical protein
MLRLTVFEFITRTIPESFVLMLAMYALSNIKIDIKKYLVSGLLLSTYVYFGRMLPISYGVHTILDIFVMIIIMCSINKADIILAIKASLVATIALYVLEELNVLLLSLIFKDKLEEIMLSTTLKVICGLPSLVLFGVVTIVYYLRKKDA